MIGLSQKKISPLFHTKTTYNSFWRHRHELGHLCWCCGYCELHVSYNVCCPQWRYLQYRLFKELQLEDAALMDYISKVLAAAPNNDCQTELRPLPLLTPQTSLERLLINDPFLSIIDVLLVHLVVHLISELLEVERTEKKHQSHSCIVTLVTSSSSPSIVLPVSASTSSVFLVGA